MAIKKKSASSSKATIHRRENDDDDNNNNTNGCCGGANLRSIPILVAFAIAFLVGQNTNPFASSQNNGKGSFLTFSDMSFGSGGVGGGDTKSRQDNLQLDQRQQRLLKYYNSYRYIPPSPFFNDIHQIAPVKECGASPDFESWFAQSGRLRSRLGEDKFIYETFFKHHQPNMTSHGSGGGGTYIELGAYDGQLESNSKFFDNCLGWKGLLMEGNPISYHRVTMNRPYAHKMSFAPSCTNDTIIQFYQYPITNVGLPGFAKTYEGKPTVDVPCGPLTPVLLDIFDGQPINFFSLDVEGSERLVLDTIDFEKVVIHVMMIEIENNDCRGDHCPVRKEVRSKMEGAGYWRYEKLVRASDIYVKKDSPFQIPASLAVANNLAA